MKKPLSGVRMLDFTRVLAGPLCTMMLADLGAEVIKIEVPGRGDDTRQWGPPWAGEGEDRQSAYYLSVNRNKRSLTLNLKTPSGRDIARRLARESQVVVENFKPGDMAKFGLGYDDLQAENPALVYCSITGFGQTGPYSSHPGYDYAIQAMSGLMSITGEKDGEPVKVGVAISDVIAGLHAVIGIQAALRHSEHTGQGQHIDIALLDTQLAALVNVASNYLVSGENPARYGNQHANIVPYQTFDASDGKFVVGAGTDSQFVLLCRLINRPDLAQDVRFATNPARVQHRHELVAVLDSIFRTRPIEFWLKGLLAADIPAGPINSVEQAFNDPHVLARGMVQQTMLSNGATLNFVFSPLKLSETPPEVTLAPPAVGEHTDEILRDVLRLDDDTIQRYHDEGIV